MQSAHQLEYLQLLGVKVWQPKDSGAQMSVPEELQKEARQEQEGQALAARQPAEQPESAPPPIALTEPHADVSALDWNALSTCVSTCTSCALHASRGQVVFGVGNKQAELMVIGEAPGEEEDEQGEPFVGRVGALLNEMLFAIQHPRETVYIANIVKCRPPENRNPQQDEAVECAGYLQRQIELVAPKAILAMGKVAAQNLLQTDLAIGKMRGEQYRYAALNIPVIVTYHPAYLLRSPREKQKVWQDLKRLSLLLAV